MYSLCLCTHVCVYDVGVLCVLCIQSVCVNTLCVCVCMMWECSVCVCVRAYARMKSMFMCTNMYDTGCTCHNMHVEIREPLRHPSSPSTLFETRSLLFFLLHSPGKVDPELLNSPVSTSHLPTGLLGDRSHANSHCALGFYMSSGDSYSCTASVFIHRTISLACWILR